MKKREIIAKTFTPIYDELEDRIRLVVNYQSHNQRIDFMITRSFILQLIPTLEEYIEKHYATVAFEDNTTQVQQYNPSLEQNLSQTDSTDLQLYQMPEELLIKLDLSYLLQTKETLLVLSSAKSSSPIQLSESILRTFLKTLKSSIPYSLWGISPYF